MEKLSALLTVCEVSSSVRDINPDDDMVTSGTGT